MNFEWQDASQARGSELIAGIGGRRRMPNVSPLTGSTRVGCGLRDAPDGSGHRDAGVRIRSVARLCRSFAGAAGSLRVEGGIEPAGRVRSLMTGILPMRQFPRRVAGKSA